MLLCYLRFAAAPPHVVMCMPNPFWWNLQCACVRSIFKRAKWDRYFKIGRMSCFAVLSISYNIRGPYNFGTKLGNF